MKFKKKRTRRKSPYTADYRRQLAAERDQLIAQATTPEAREAIIKAYEISIK